MPTRTIGGNRVGSGKKMKAHLMNYYRSTHNLSEKWASSMGSGILYPAMCKLAMRGDTFDIGINADARTIPTQGPLFGSYKMQIDVYQCPLRLYQALLHNNPLALGLNMSKVKFPIMEITQKTRNKEAYKFSNSSLLKYLGLSGIGTPNFASDEITNAITREFNAIPMLAYYDIFKTYYANKQEEIGYVIKPEYQGYKKALTRIEIWDKNSYVHLMDTTDIQEWNEIPVDENTVYNLSFEREAIEKNGYDPYTQMGEIATFIAEHIFFDNGEDEYTLEELKDSGAITYQAIRYTDRIRFRFEIVLAQWELTMGENANTLMKSTIDTENYGSKIVLKPFDLENIDTMRYNLLSHHTLGVPYKIKDYNQILPYEAVVGKQTINVLNQETVNNSHFAEAGLVLKTYQNDIFNNWLNTEWIEGENGISELSKVEVVDGAFTMDALNFAQKLYNMLNRIAIAGATYEDWQDVVYEEVKRKQIESPIFCGGMSQEIYFDEIVQTAPAEGNPLGTLGGRGRLSGKKNGGKLHIKCDEACFIIAIVSLTPRIYQTQGNEFYMTDIFSMDDIHKPAMDGIGFQDLIGERMAYFDTQISDTEGITHRSKIGKLPAWMEYMTSYDRAYGDFAEVKGKGYMILNRNYEQDEETGLIKDATTYVDPSKYNYVFAYTAIEAQNFWVQINFDIKARRLMSARLIPNV